MSILDLMPFILTAAAIGFIYLRRKNASNKIYQPRDIHSMVSRDVFIEKNVEEFKEALSNKLKNYNVLIHSEDDTRKIYEEDGKGLFSWGFLYIIDFEERTGGTYVTFGIFARGKNPPRKKTLDGFLNDFLSKVMPL